MPPIDLEQFENLKKLQAMTKDELELLKGMVRDLLDCPSLTVSGPKALGIIVSLDKLVRK